jgi:7,8-dihydro-6-hydroxymethylpterin-pyrophosphokinase
MEGKRSLQEIDLILYTQRLSVAINILVTSRPQPRLAQRDHVIASLQRLAPALGRFNARAMQTANSHDLENLHVSHTHSNFYGRLPKSGHFLLGCQSPW